MEYIFEVFQMGPHGKPRRLDTFTRPEELRDGMLEKGQYIAVYDAAAPAKVLRSLYSNDEIGDFLEMLARNIWLDKPVNRPPTVEEIQKMMIKQRPVREPVPEKDAINPSHYQDFMLLPEGSVEQALQWLEHLQYHRRYRNPEVFKGAVEMQIRKYLDRNGGKDAELQETLKGLWYHKFLAAYVKNGNEPIFVKDIDRILGE